MLKPQFLRVTNEREPQLWNRVRFPPEGCTLRIMRARQPEPGWQIGLRGETNNRWDAIWQLVLQAEQLPAGERGVLLRSADTDPFIIGQAVAILEGTESFATAAASLEISRQEQ